MMPRMQFVVVVVDGTVERVARKANGFFHQVFQKNKYKAWVAKEEQAR